MFITRLEMKNIILSAVYCLALVWDKYKFACMCIIERN